RGVAVGARRDVRRVVTAEAMCEKRIEVDLFLTHESAPRQVAGDEQIDRGTDARGRGDLDRAPVFAADATVVHLPRVGNLHELPILPARHGAERHDEVLKRDWYRALEDVFEHIAALAEAQLVDEQ